MTTEIGDLTDIERITWDTMLEEAYMQHGEYLDLETFNALKLGFYEQVAYMRSLSEEEQLAILLRKAEKRQKTCKPCWDE